MRLIFILASLVIFQSVYADEHADALAAYKKGDYTTSFRESKKLAERGNADAQGLLGLMYYGGDGVERDTAQAVNWLQKGAENGSATTQYLLGFLYLGGEGVEQNIAQAYVWFYLSASQGNKSAEEFRDVAANSMTSAQISEAQALAKEWAEKYNKN